MNRPKKRIRQEQVIYSCNGDLSPHPTVPGYVRTALVRCPFCGVTSEVYTPDKKGLEFAENNCRHALGAVSAGGFRGAIHFEGYDEQA